MRYRAISSWKWPKDGFSEKDDGSKNWGHAAKYIFNRFKLVEEKFELKFTFCLSYRVAAGFVAQWD